MKPFLLRALGESAARRVPAFAAAVLVVLGGGAGLSLGLQRPAVIAEAELSSEPSSSETSSAPASSSEAAPTSSAAPAPARPAAPARKPVTTPKAPAANATVLATPPQTGNYAPNAAMDMDDNVFMDALIYTGCNVAKRRADGLLWQYVSASRKRGLGYLSKIGYGGGSTGYETNAAGKPDIALFERRGLVCASFVSYVYFNYLPNVAGYDVSSLTRPAKSTNANDWLLAARDWIKKGYSASIPFAASGSPGGFLRFTPGQEIPIGSVIAFENARNRNGRACHVGIYAGARNGTHFMYHVGNSNGPELCAIERVLFGSDPVYPLQIISRPKNIRWAAALTLTLRDDAGRPISGVAFTLKNRATGKTVSLGKTNAAGQISRENLPYGNYTLMQAVPAGYTCAKPNIDLTLTTRGNSLTTVSLTDVKDKPPVSSAPASSSDPASSSPASSSAPASSSSAPESGGESSSVPEDTDVSSSTSSSDTTSQDGTAD